jgi:hypothetical protein
MNSDRILLGINPVQRFLKAAGTLNFSIHVQTFGAIEEPIIQQIINKTHLDHG